ncbi:phage terminase small subunit [Sphingobium sp. AN558]|uniref:phage terminase small subunit n=1 Tax=Sphingobium sp. AN558 TaxID=3133442 RepID=UPI0030C22EA6
MRPVALRLSHDLRRLKEIKAISLKIDAKRQMLPEYRDWIDGLVAADAGVGTGIAAEVAPTIMVWMIDIGLYAEALDLAAFLLRHHVSMPARYNRDVATVIVEEIADAALKDQAAGNRFPLDILERVEELVDGLDMHDEAPAKLFKAIGIESLMAVEAAEATPELGRAIEHVLGDLRRAQTLQPRIGVKHKIKRAEKLLAAHATAFPPAPEQDGDQQGSDAA